MNEVSTQVNNTAMAIPADLAALFADVKPMIVTTEQMPHLSIGGKVWKVVKEGNETAITTLVDGEPMPAPTVKVVIVNQIPTRSRAFFKGNYVEGSSAAPDCWSTEGIRPDADCSSPQAASCETCPQSVKGSKISEDGVASTACRQSKRICVVPSNKPDFTALQLKLPVTSLWEQNGEEEAQGWYAYDAYLKYLKANGISHPQMCETIMKFDSKVKYPKVLFKYNGYLPYKFAAVIKGRTDSEEVMKCLGLGKKSEASAAITAPVAEKVTQAPVVDDGWGAPEAVVQTEEPKAEKPKRQTKPKVDVVEGSLEDALNLDW